MPGSALSPPEREEIRAFLVDDPIVPFASIAVTLGRMRRPSAERSAAMGGVSGIGQLVHNSEQTKKASALARAS